MLRKNELVSEVKKVLLDHGTDLWSWEAEDVATDIVNRVLELIQSETKIS